MHFERVYRSEDGGHTWIESDAGLPMGLPLIGQTVPDGRVYVGYWNEGHGIYRTK